MDGLYKVLVDGRGPYSGVAWPLPTDDGPGDWVEAHDPGPLVMCRNGVHLTDWTGVWSGWARARMAVYEVEADGERIGDITTDDRKIAVRRARLTRRVPDAELPAWWRAAMAFVASIPATPWFAPAGDPDPAWRMFDIRARAAYAAADAAYAAADAAADAAARNAAAYAAAYAAADAAYAAADAAAYDAARNAAAYAAARNAAYAAADAAAYDAARNAAAYAAARNAAYAAATAAYDAATAAAYATTAYDAHDAAYDAALLARCLIVADHIDPEYLAHARARWDVWQRGYGLAGVVDDVFYVYRQP